MKPVHALRRVVQRGFVAVWGMFGCGRRLRLSEEAYKKYLSGDQVDEPEPDAVCLAEVWNARLAGRFTEDL